MHTIVSILLFLLFAVDPVIGASPFETRGRELFTDFNSGCFEGVTKDFNEEMRATVTREVLQKMRRRVEDKFGRLIEITNTRDIRTADGLRAVDIEAKYEKSSVAFRVQFDQSFHVAALAIDPMAAKADEPKYEQIARDWFAEFSAGRYDDAFKRFSTVLQTQLPPAKLALLASEMQAYYGKSGSVTSASPTIENGYKAIELKVLFGTGPIVVRIAFDNVGAIGGLSIRPIDAPQPPPPPRVPPSSIDPRMLGPKPPVVKPH